MFHSENLRAVVAGQHGLVTARQLEDDGIRSATIGRLASSGEFEKVRRGVYRVECAPKRQLQRPMGAVLGAGPGAVASHTTALALWGIWRPAVDDVLHVTVAYGLMNRPVPGAVVHRTRRWATSDHTSRHGIPVTSPVRTLLDVGWVLGPRAAEMALDRALERRLTSYGEVVAGIDRLGGKGCRGVAVMKRVLAARELGALPPESELEARMAVLVRDFRLPRFHYQFKECRPGGRVAIIDFAYPDHKIAIEVDGFDTRVSRESFYAERHRANDLVELGWTVVRLTWRDIVDRPGATAARVRRILRQREGQPGPSSVRRNRRRRMKQRTEGPTLPRVLFCASKPPPADETTHGTGLGVGVGGWGWG